MVKILLAQGDERGARSLFRKLKQKDPKKSALYPELEQVFAHSLSFPTPSTSPLDSDLENDAYLDMLETWLKALKKN